MLVVKNVGLNNNVVLFSTEFASTILSQVIIESFTDNEYVCALSNRAHVWIHSLDTVWEHGEITGGPGVGVESHSYEKTFTFVDEWEFIVHGTSDGVRIEELGLGKGVTNSASEFTILEIISESSTNNVDSTCTIIRSNEWSDIINNTLSIVMEVSESLFDSLKLDSEGDRSEIVLTLSVMGHFILWCLSSKHSSILIFIDVHWALDQVEMNS